MTFLRRETYRDGGVSYVWRQGAATFYVGRKLHERWAIAAIWRAGGARR